MTSQNSKDPFAAVYKRVGRRETHSPRSVLAIVLACALMVCAVWLGTELVLAITGLGPLLLSPATVLATVFTAPQVSSATVIAAAAALTVAGLVLVIAALAPGRKARHLLHTPESRVLAVVDNEVIASALARRAAESGRVSPDNVEASVTHRASRVYLVPVSGVSVNSAEVVSAVKDHLTALALVPPVTASVRIATEGKVGA